jgi:hypothetical protein
VFLSSWPPLSQWLISWSCLYTPWQKANLSMFFCVIFFLVCFITVFLFPLIYCQVFNLISVQVWSFEMVMSCPPGVSTDKKLETHGIKMEIKLICQFCSYNNRPIIYKGGSYVYGDLFHHVLQHTVIIKSFWHFSELNVELHWREHLKIMTFLWKKYN